MAGEHSSRNEEQDDAQRPWDADDARRQKDQMAPPMEPCDCFCLHCHRTFCSDKIWFQKIMGSRDGFDGFWMCPTPNCSGAGFTFDIFPTDPNHPANDGWFGDDEEGDKRSWEEEGEYEAFKGNEDEPEIEYDPDEPRYKMMQQWDDDQDDIEGEEWKFGLEPGQFPEMPSGAQMDAAAWEAEQEKKYNEPDRRPRELDWTDSERHGPTDDNIPF